MNLWNRNTEIDFFQNALKSFASPEQLFYKLNNEYFAYIPKGMKSKGQVIQSRNSLIGQYTEKWSQLFFEDIANKLGLYAVSGVACTDLGLARNSRADLAFCTTNETEQKASNIKLIFEVKMSIVSNYKYKNINQIEYLGDYKTHKGNPSLLRSDSMLKAIGKSVNIRVSSPSSSKIPIIILGNSPITNSYKSKVDFLKKSGMIQGFWSLHPEPTEKDYIEVTQNQGFKTFKNKKDVIKSCEELITNELNYFSSMMPTQNLGKIINLASKEPTDIERAKKFLKLINK